MTDAHPLGPIVDDFGVSLHLDPDDRVTDMLVLAKVTDLKTGQVRLSMASNDLDWIAKLGLLTAANVALMDVDVETGD